MSNISEKYDLLQHLNRVSELSYKMAQFMGLEEEYCKEIGIAGHLHDIGKMLIFQDILNKPGTLSQEEKSYLKEHVKYSLIIGMLMEDKLSKNILTMIFQHHENNDGTGYPNSLIGEQILIGSHIVKICDVYDAMRSERPYRGKLTKEQSLKLILEEKTKYNAQCINALIEIEKIYSLTQAV